MVWDRVPALLYAWGGVQGPAIELLTQLAAAAWTAMSEPPAPSQPESAWDRLPLEEQRIHLRAQRSARVQVADVSVDTETGVVKINRYVAVLAG